MIAMFWDNHRRPLRTYRHARVLDYGIDGEVEIDSLLMPSVDGYEQRVITYDRRNSFNAAVLAATQVLLPEIHDPQTRRQLVRVSEMLAPQAAVRRPKHHRLPGRARRWQSLHDLSVDVLKGFGVAYEPVAVKAPGFVLATWQVWENLLALAVGPSWRGLKVARQRSVQLGVRRSFDGVHRATSRAVRVVPDLKMGESDGFLVDAKYKGRVADNANRISEADLYEALAFATATKLTDVVLIYPAVPRDVTEPQTGVVNLFEEIAVENILVRGVDVEVRGIARRGGFRAFSARLREGIERLLPGIVVASPT